MAKRSDHRKHLSSYLSQQKNNSGRNLKTTKNVTHVHKAYTKRVAFVTDLPDEITLKIFNYLEAQDLLIAAQVCKSWHILANDNSLWRPIFQTFGVSSKDAFKKRTPTEAAESIHLSSQQLKSLCIKSCVEQRNKKAYKVLKKINPYTGVLQMKEIEQSLMTVGVFWQLALVDSSGNEHHYYNRDVSWHLMSVSLRWYALEMISLRQIKQIRVYSCNPLFFNKTTGQAVKKGPYQRSLLQVFDIRWSAWVSTNKPVGSDDMVNLYSLPGGLMIATWKDGGELAFISIGFHGDDFVNRCLKGNSTEPYIPSVPQELFDDIDSAFGLHSYSCTIQLRTMKQSLWDQRFRNLDSSPGGALGYATFILIEQGERQIFNKDLVFPWKTDAFKGKVQNASWLDVTLIDEKGKVFWTVSSLVKVGDQTLQKTLDFNYSEDNKFCIDYTDHIGKFHMETSKTDDNDSYITELVIMISLDAINRRFGTAYR